jgi:hypothetical protein
MIKNMTHKTDMSERPAPAIPMQTLPVYSAQQFRVYSGANFGDPIAHADEIELADIYHLEKGAIRLHLSVSVNEDDITVSSGSAVGRENASLHMDCVLTLMGSDGSIVEALILIETDEHGMIEDTYFLPLGALQEKHDYAVVAFDRKNARTRLAEVACVSFTQNTLITLANGMQKQIQDLKVNDKVLTRDHGPREIRWIGHQTVRATGDFAPIVIKKGALNNENDLIVSPNHRIFIYQRKDRVRAGRAEVLIKAKLLVNGDNVVQSDGGFVEYYQLLFDGHEIIYAEGIAAESMFVDTQVKPYLPADVQARLSTLDKIHEPPRAFELADGVVEPHVAAELLRSASAS